MDRIQFSSPLLHIGTTVHTARDPIWGTVNETAGCRVFSFFQSCWGMKPAQKDAPTSVFIPGDVAFTQPGKSYSRRLIDPRGQLSGWLWMNDQQLESCVGKLMESPSRSCTPTASVALEQRRLQQMASHSARHKPIEIQDQAIRYLCSLAEHLDFESPAIHEARRIRGQDRVIAAMEYIIKNISSSSMCIDEVADVMDLSPCHACVVFKQVTGQSISRRVKHIRLVSSLDRLSQGGRDLTEIALEYGFSSHAYYTSCFHKSFGVTPSQARNLLR